MKNVKFISVPEAKDAIVKNVKAGPVVRLKIQDAASHVLARNVKSPYHSPPFDQSAMDGYAFRFGDLAAGGRIEVIGESAAGRNFSGTLKINQAVRIFTGAKVPAGADTVVMQEKCTIKNNFLLVNDELLRQGSNIRMAGEQIRKNEVAVASGAILNPGTIGYIASLGVAVVDVYRKPSVSVIVTGDELVPPGSHLKPGQIFESNSVTLLAALKEEGIADVKVMFAKDNFVATEKTFRKAIAHSDFILFTGGISVGDYDFVGKVMSKQRVKTIFYKVRQKPGKPIYFGTKSGAYIFGLPGNPASVITCYYEYVKTAIKKFQHYASIDPVLLTLPVTGPVKKKPGLTLFLKGYTDFGTVTLLQEQESYKMKSFKGANCLIVMDELQGNIEAGEMVQVHLL